jgi:serine/threonine protein kinase
MAYTFRHGDRPLEGITVQRAVGRGGFGEVYYATSDAGKQLALKYLRDNPDVELRGIAHVMNLKSPHLITIYDVRHSIEGDPFVVMEYVSGPSLRDVMNAEPNGFSPEKAAYFLNGIAQGLSYLHERGIVHRDLKPGNIFYDDGYVKIGDYGLSKHISVSQHSGNTVSVGTVHYMAPEIGSGSYSKAIDIYSLGVILYEMLTGRLPFTGKSMGEILMRHLNDHPDLRGLPSGFGPIISKALAKEPTERYQSVDAFVDAVANIADIEDSLSAFDPKTLTNVPRTDTSDAATRTSPPPVPHPDLDVHGLPGGVTGPQKRVRNRIKAAQDRVTAALHDIETRFHDKGKKAKKNKKQGPAQYVDAPIENRGTQIVTLLLVTSGVAMALGFLTRLSSEESMAVFWFMVSSVVGTLLVQMKLLAKNPNRHWLFDRIVLTSAAAIFMFPGFLMAEHRTAGQGIGAALLITIFIFDWSRRIEAGRRGKINGDDAIWPAILGAIVAGKMEGNPIVGGAVAAVVSLLTQATAGLWPLYKVRTQRPDDPTAGAYGGRPPAPEPQPTHVAAQPPPPPLPTLQGSSDAAVTAGPAKASTQAATVQPSFVGHRANGATIILSKLLMMIGFAVVFSAAYANVSEVWSMPETPLHHLMLRLAPINWMGLWGIGGGVLLLALSRRRTSWLHISRALLSGVLLLIAAMVAGAPAAIPRAAQELARGGAETLSDGDVGWPIIMFAITVILATVMLNWRHRPKDMVVV